MIEVTRETVKVGDVVQLTANPPHSFHRSLAGCFLLVEGVRSWGVQGYVEVPGEGRAYVRVRYGDEMAWIGRAYWVPEDVVANMEPPDVAEMEPADADPGV